jgi:hypothetical protein
MSRLRTRARHRRALLESVRAEFVEKRSNPEEFEHLLRRIAESDRCLWAVARDAAGNHPLDDDERAIIAKIVAPHLAWTTPGYVQRRDQLEQ